MKEKDHRRSRSFPVHIPLLLSPPLFSLRRELRVKIARYD